VEITAAYTASAPTADVTDEQIQNTRYWMLGQSDKPSKPHRRRRLQISSPQIKGMFLPTCRNNCMLDCIYAFFSCLCGDSQPEGRGGEGPRSRWGSRQRPSAAGIPTLVVDMDPQGNSTTGLGVTDTEFTVNDVLYADQRGIAAEAIVETSWPNVSVIPPISHGAA
ncbi:hypothetical protein GS426_19975, partial [Rhodococcus hoagii]|nr:hypothetical protein [Prescottella equi]